MPIYIYTHMCIYIHTYMHTVRDKNHTLIMYFIYIQIIVSLYMMFVTINRRNERNNLIQSYKQ